MHLKFSSSILGGMRGTFIQSVTPLAPNKHQITHHVYIEPSWLGRLFSKFLLFGEAKMVNYSKNYPNNKLLITLRSSQQIERDIVIWNNKKYLKNPLFTKEEKTIVKFRRWFTQFYSENSPRYLDQVQAW